MRFYFFWTASCRQQPSFWTFRFCLNLFTALLLLSVFLFSGVLRASPGTRELRTDFRSWSLEDKVSQLFILGFRNPAEIAELRPGGAIFFSWNMPSVDKSRETALKLAALNHKLPAPLFLATDHEGGQVLRLREGITAFPDALTVGALNDPLKAFRFGKIMGHELSFLGLNMNLAPVLDLGNARSFLANRVWGEQPELVAKGTLSFIQGSLAAGVVPVAKHFPGHGLSAVDSHFALPRIEKTLEELWSTELEPFRVAIAKGAPVLMSAHVQVPAVDRLPASMSRRFLTEILREQMGFEGLIISDDMEMAATDLEGLELSGSGQVQGLANRAMPEKQQRAVAAGERALQALQAGSDMVMIVWSADVQKQAIRRVTEAVRSGELPMDDLHKKLDRIVRVKELYLPRLGPEQNMYWRQGLRQPATQDFVAELSQEAIQWQSPDYQSLLQRLKRDRLSAWHVYLPNQRAQVAWRRFRPNDRLSILPRRPSSAELERLEAELSATLRSNIGQNVLVMSPPRAVGSEALFALLRRTFHGFLTDPQRYQASSLLWVHQGPRPLRLNSDQAPMAEVFKRFGLLSLHGSSESNLEALTKLLPRPFNQAKL